MGHYSIRSLVDIVKFRVLSSVIDCPANGVISPSPGDGVILHISACRGSTELGCSWMTCRTILLTSSWARCKIGGVVGTTAFGAWNDCLRAHRISWRSCEMQNQISRSKATRRLFQNNLKAMMPWTWMRYELHTAHPVCVPVFEIGSPFAEIDADNFVL